MFPRIRAALCGVALLVLVSCTGHAPMEDGEPPGNRENLDAGISEPATDSMYPDFGNEDIDVLHYGLNLDYEPESQRLSGAATLTIRPVRDGDEIKLDFSEAMAVSRATVDDKAVDFSQREWDLKLDTPVRADDQVTVTVDYQGTPKLVPAPAQRADMAEGLGASVDTDSGALWSFQEPYGALTWYPVNDHPSDEALYDFNVSVPDGYSAVASGTFKGRDGNTFQWSSSDPVASYLTTIAVDKFEMIEMTGPNGLPITAWIPPRYQSMEPVARRMPEMIGYLEEHYGPYPFDSAGVVVVGGESAMETQEMITFSGVMSDFGAESVMVHELAHQWFGDAVTPGDWTGLWINEGPATYAEQMWNVDEGLMDTDEVVDEWRAGDSISRAESGPPGDPDPGAFADNNSYICPALMLYELGEELDGREDVDELLTEWARQNHNETVSREDFIAFANSHTGEDFTEFFDEWLDSDKTPT